MNTIKRAGTRRRVLAAVAGFGLVATALPAAATAINGPVSAVTQLAGGQYIVVLKSAPLATNPGTAAAEGQKLDTRTAGARSYTDALLAQQAKVLDQVEAQPIYQYTTVLNGFAVELTGDEATALSQRSDVLSVTRSTVRQLDQHDQQGAPGLTAQPDTDVSPDLLGLRGPGGVWEQLGGPGQAGKDTVVGMLDSGLAWDNPSFSADGIGAAPADWTGICDSGEDAADWPAEACTNKVIGARYFVAGARGEGAVIDPADSVSPWDTGSHGSHTASTAAGRPVKLTGGGKTYNIAGMAPAAHISVYKVCWEATDPDASGCYDADSIAAIEAGVTDGVDVLNFSISGDPETFQDPVDMAFKNAAASGVFVAASAGNYADEGVPVAHIGPWMTTVAAAIHKPEDGPVPSVIDWSGRGPVAVPSAQQTILKPDIGAPGINVLAAFASDDTGPGWGWMSGTSMSSPHIAGLALLLEQAHSDWSPMETKSAMLTSTRDYVGDFSNDPFVGGTGFVEPRKFMAPGLVFDNSEADWDAFLADKASGYDLNTAYVQIPQLGADGPTTTTRTLTNPGTAEVTYTAAYSGPDTLSVTVTPATVTVPAGGSVDVEVAVANTGAPINVWQKGHLTWTGSGNDVRIPVIARGEVSDEVPPTDPMVERVWGPNRYGTAAEVADLYPEGVDTVYVTSGQGFADAMAGSPAAARGLVPAMLETPEGDPAPVLLVKKTSIPSETDAAIEALNPANIVVLGGTNTVSQAVEDELVASYDGDVSRVDGADRYETAANLAMMFPQNLPVVYVASGANPAYPDALTGAALAGMDNAPVLLTKPGEVPAKTAEALAYLNADQVIVLGGEKSVTPATYAALGASDRIAGADRYDTAIQISSNNYDSDIPVVYIANGRDYPDALAGSALAGFEEVPVLITSPTTLRDDVLAELDRLSPERVVILGGTSSVSQEIEDELNEHYPGWVG